MYGKRGQEGGTLTTLIVIIILAVLAILLILFLTGFFGDIGEAQNILTEQTLTLLSQSCNLKADQGDKPGYCDTFVEVTFSSGLKSFVSCQYPQVESSLEREIDSSVCGSLSENSREFCAELEGVEGTNFDRDTNVNGVDCDTHLKSTAPSTITRESKKKCEDLAGDGQKAEWLGDLNQNGNTVSSVERCTDSKPVGFEGTVRTAGVTDQGDKDGNIGKICCVYATN